AQLLVPDAADCFALGVVGTEEVPTLVEASHVDPHLVPELQARLRELVAHSGGAADQLLGHVRHGEVIHSEQTRAAHWAFLAGLDVASGVAAPLEVAGEVRGFMVLAAGEGRDAVALDLDFARCLADRVSLALDQARLFRRMERAVGARDGVLGIVSDDLRNPLSTIQICASALLDPDPPLVSGVRRIAQIILASAAWMHQIAEDLLDRASLDAGRLALIRSRQRAWNESSPTQATSF